MNDDQLAAFMRDNKLEFSGPTPESEAEAQWEEQVIEAIESGAIARRKPGRRQVRPLYLAKAQKCLSEANGNVAQARAAFIKQVTKAHGIKDDTAANRWAEAMRPLSTKR